MADGGRLFFEVFPTIKVNKDLELLFAKTIVKKVTTSSEGDRLCVCILSDHLIDYTAVKKMSEIIKHTLFADRNMAVNILQRYELPDNYDLPAVMSVYRDSILEEIKDKDHLIAIAFKNAEISFRDGKIMHLVIPDTRTNRSSEDRLISMLEKILTERCGVDCIIETEYREDDKLSKHKAADEAKLARKIAQIAAQAHIATVYSDNADNADTEEEVVTSESESEEEPIEEAAVTASAVATSDKSSDKKSYDKDSSSDKHDYKRRALKRSDYPGLIYGKEFAGDAIPMSDIVGEIGDVIIRGEVISTEAREIRNERTIYFFDVSDYTDTFRLKVFIHNDQVAEISSELKVGAFIKVSGSAQYDSYEKELTIGQITGIMQIPSFKVSREDNAIEKRVELHCHTKMSDMDGVSDVKDIINRAYKWGHPAIAITDHGVAQAFPDAWHT